uniref:G-protein coupled receptors family 3 profile domain-containing protein n=1 Tax=Bombyx mori TaxID=7091 RepID=A0A8R2M6P5_BOMMO|nr:metabotropic glutamate receptor 5-like [Bombyx mori]
MRFESDQRGEWRYVRVGRWRRGALHLRGGTRAAYRRGQGVRGVCSEPCGVGEWARAGEGRARCCWTCVPCPPLAITVPPPAPGCKPCLPGHRPDLTRTRCIPSPVEWSGGGRPRAIATLTGAIGLITVCFFSVVLWHYRKTPVVKSASRELCALLLCSAASCHGAALAGAIRPAGLSCAAVRLAAPALGGVYAAVVARTMRVARLVAAVEKRPAARPRLLSSRAQVWTWLALSTPGWAMAAWSATSWPPVARLLHPGRARSVLACAGETATAQLVPLAPALVLLGACVLLAVRTRRLPHNLNETKFVGAAAYATCVTWLAFFPLYAVTEARTACLCACVSLSAGACVLLSLGPRVWVCLCRPERNTRAHFLTATSIRCHLGKYRSGRAARPSATVGESREASSQTTECGECGECGAAGRCARVTRWEGPESAHVLIVLYPHRHVAPLSLAHYAHDSPLADRNL